jgi:carbonic anhydrase
VCGHTHCGGIAALLEPIPPDREAHLGRWVDYTRPAHRLIEAARVPEAERLTATIKAHVQFQLDNLLTYAIVREGLAAGQLNIHGWLYDMEHGALSAYNPETGEWHGLLELAGV